MPTRIFHFLICLFILSCNSPTPEVVLENAPTVWPDSLEWWKPNNLRVIQTNLPAYEGSLSPDSLIQDLQRFSANVLLINAGGIMAFYPTKLEYQYTNPYMKPEMLKDVVAKCHQAGIKVIVRFDFSRAHKSIFEKHPDWFYISPEGERIINDDMYVVSINAPYEQEQLFNIIGEVINTFSVDGIFINMPGYQTRNPYVSKYHGIDQNPYDKKRFAEFSHGLKLPVKEDFDDPVFKKYMAFKEFTTEDLMKRLHQLVKAKSKQIAICTYSDKYVDIIRHESQTNSLPYWPYNASDNVNSTRTSFPDHIVSNASIQQISFQSRYNAVEPEEVAIRLYENIANGSGLDISLMGDFQNYEDERNYDIVTEVYAHHKKYEKYYGRYTTTAEVAVIAPGSWPSGEAAQEYRGIQLMLKEAHIQYDIIEDSEVGNLAEKMKRYRVVVLPEIARPDSAAVDVLSKLVYQGTNLIATNHSFSTNPVAMRKLFGAVAVEGDHDGAGFYLAPNSRTVFGRLSKQKIISWKFNLSLYDFPEADTFLNIYTPGRPGPPEIIGGHSRTKYYGLGIKDHGKSKAALFTGNIGRLYYLHGYEQYKNIFLDVLDYITPEVSKRVTTNAPPRVEVIVQRFVENKPDNLNKNLPENLIVHLVNLTGFSGNTYFDPLIVRDITIEVTSDFQPAKVFSLIGKAAIKFSYSKGIVKITLPELNKYDAVVIER